jgi:hypothetical protein
MARSRNSNFEGSKQDILEDRRNARKNKMTLKQWEESPQDVEHDKKGFASGGKVRGMGAAKKGGKYSVC